MEVIAGGRLCDLVEQRMRVAQHHRSHRGAARQFGAEQRGRHAQALARHLDIDAGRCAVVAEQQRQADDALVSDRADLGRRAVAHGVDEEPDPGFDEVDEIERPARTVERLPVGEGNALEMAVQTPAIPGRQQCQQSVGRSLRRRAPCHLFVISQ